MYAADIRLVYDEVALAKDGPGAPDERDHAQSVPPAGRLADQLEGNDSGGNPPARPEGVHVFGELADERGLVAGQEPLLETAGQRHGPRLAAPGFLKPIWLRFPPQNLAKPSICPLLFDVNGLGTIVLTDFSFRSFQIEGKACRL